jgi:hypothetical protein
MKLARPDIRHPRIVLAGTGDDAGLIAALRKRGLHARSMPWDDPDALRADLVILRAAPHDRHNEFLAWTRRVLNLLNARDVVAWNSGRRYLRDIQHAGVPIQPRAQSQTALVFFGGAQSYAFGPQGPVDADFEQWDVGHAALRAAAEYVSIGADELLYARADVSDDKRLTALDLVAPSLGWELLDDAARQDVQRQYALCVESALERLGLGPLSHRRP